MTFLFNLWLNFYHKILWLPFLKVILGGEFYLSKSLKENDQFILVCNHSSHLDTQAMLCSTPFSKLYRTHPVAAKDYFGKTLFHKVFFKLTMNTFLIDRESGNGEEVISKIVKELDRGSNLIIFPEGSRSVGQELRKFKSGVVRVLMQRPNIPYIPVYVESSDRILPKGDPLVVPHNFKVRFGDAKFIDTNIDINNNLEKMRSEIVSLKS